MVWGDLKVSKKCARAKFYNVSSRDSSNVVVLQASNYFVMRLVVPGFKIVWGDLAVEQFWDRAEVEAWK